MSVHKKTYVMARKHVMNMMDESRKSCASGPLFGPLIAQPQPLLAAANMAMNMDAPKAVKYVREAL